MQGILLRFMGANPSLFSCIRGLNYLRILVGDCVLEDGMGGRGCNRRVCVCARSHAITETS